MAFNSGNNYVFEFITDSFWLAKKMAAAFDVGENTYYSPIIKGQCSVPEFVLNHLHNFQVLDLVVLLRKYHTLY